jgi:hypothetical protein
MFKVSHVSPSVVVTALVTLAFIGFASMVATFVVMNAINARP